MKFLLILSVWFSACGAEPMAVTRAADSTEQDKQSRPELGMATPVIAVLSSAAVAACFFWLRKYCADVLYLRIAKPHYGAEDWRKHLDFLRSAFSTRVDDDAFKNIEKDVEDMFGKAFDDMFGEGAWDRYKRQHGNPFNSDGQRQGRQPEAAPYQGRDPYRVMGLDENATDEQIKEKFRQLARQYHPDKNPGNEQAAGRFIEIADAYEELKRRGKVR